jgi:hypothetical protein
VDPLSVRMVEHAVVYPTIRVQSLPGKLLMGVFDGDGRYVDDTVLDRRSGEQGAPVPTGLFPVVTDAAQPEAIYAGPLYFHFGHFLLESLARAWYAHRDPELPLVWAGQHTWQGRELLPWQTEILELLGISNPTALLADPTRYDRLHVPDIGYRYDDRFHPEHAAFLGRYEGPAQVRGRRLWLSRSSIETDVRDLNAEPTERRLARAGWTVRHPEVLSVREQLDELCQAEVVAGEEGSAFHTLVLLRDVSAKRFHVLRRYGREHRNLRTIGDARQVRQTFHTVDHQVVLRAEGRAVSKISPNSAAVLDLLRVPVPAPPSGAPDWADHVVGEVLARLEPQRLLDVDSASLRLLLGSAAPARVAVSARLDVDPRVLVHEDVDVYELGLEQYAEHFHDGRDPFDVVRLGGAPFPAVMEAFGVSKRLAHDRTVWVLGCGRLAGRVAVAVQTMHPGYAAERLLVQRKLVFVVRRVPDQPIDEEGVGRLTAEQVKRRTRWLRPTTVQRLRGPGVEPLA